ncbi:hypothetical protein AK812_SmicGene27054 [Symbiodinium microadriaticum]|uniref:Uncharacterized protein n=1 Tax=Symbiodinium microadriaticum TaxID=2951 RepID=A0A1Q9D7R2_SYMMI|nr:hypothetical protein AK812_SmicGene27054 [Symbiodinium microadriaticum]
MISKSPLSWQHAYTMPHFICEHPAQRTIAYLDEQSEALAILCSALNLDQASMDTVSPGNWRPAEEDPETVTALLAEEEAAGWIQQVNPLCRIPEAVLMPTVQEVSRPFSGLTRNVGLSFGQGQDIARGGGTSAAYESKPRPRSDDIAPCVNRVQASARNYASEASQSRTMTYIRLPGVSELH